MIETEVLTIVNGTGDRPGDLNSLVDQFRDGRDSEDLLSLLRSENNELVRIGAWMTGEISFDRYNTPFFIDRLRELTNHEIPAIRFHALKALYPSLDPMQQETRDLIAKSRNDANEGVRLTAEAAAKTLGLE